MRIRVPSRKVRERLARAASLLPLRAKVYKCLYLDFVLDEDG